MMKVCDFIKEVRHFVIFLVIVSLLLLSSCATTFKPVCRHNAILAALTVGEKYPVRLVWGNVSGNWQNHVQAQALIDGQWRWLDVIGGTVQIGDQDNYNAWNVMTVREFIDFEWKTGVK